MMPSQREMEEKVKMKDIGTCPVCKRTVHLWGFKVCTKCRGTNYNAALKQEGE